MLYNLALMVLCGLVLSGTMQKLEIPGLVGMLLTGIVLGPYALDLIAPELLGISADLREIALIVILTRAGLALDIEDLKKVGCPAILMCFVPFTVVTGLLAGAVLGLCLVKLFQRIHIRDTVKILILLSVSFLLVSFEAAIKAYVPMSGLLAVMALGGTILKQHGVLA